MRSFIQNFRFIADFALGQGSAMIVAALRGAHSTQAFATAPISIRSAKRRGGWLTGSWQLATAGGGDSTHTVDAHAAVLNRGQGYSLPECYRMPVGMPACWAKRLG